MLKRWFAPVVVASVLTGCGVSSVGQYQSDMINGGLVGAQSVDGHGLGYRFGAGRHMNPFTPAIFHGQALPSQVDLRSQDSQISDQGNLGSCTAFAMGRGLRQFLEIKEANQVAKQQPFGSFINVPVRAAATFTELSPLWLYYEERVLEGHTDEDDGATLGTGMSVLSNEGIAPEADWPYDINNFTTKPPANSYKDAPAFKIHSDTSLNTLDDIKTAVAGGWPVVFGFTVYPNFMNIGANGMMPMPSGDDLPDGGHAVMVVGYDDAKKVLIMRNSWGSTWGDHGYFYMPYAFVTPDNVEDIWTAQ